MSIIIPSIQDVKAANLPSGMIRSGGQLADLVYPDLHRGCVLAMPFSLGATGGTSLDVSGYGNNGTLTGGPTWQGRNGLSFDGVDDYVDAGNNATLDNLNPLTFSLWAKPNTFTTNSAYLEKGANVSFYNVISGGNNTLRFVRKMNGAYIVRTSQNWTTTGEWQHFSVTWNGSNDQTGVIIYRNGIPSSSYDTFGNDQDGGGTPLNSDAAADQWIGDGNGLSTNEIDGSLDDPRIYNRALSASEIARLYSAGRPGVTGGIYQARTKPKVFTFASAPPAATTGSRSASRIVIPSIQDVKASHLPSGTIRAGGQLADLVYPDLHRGCVLAMPFSLGATGNTSLDVSGYGNNGTLTNGPTWQGRDGLDVDGVDDYVNLVNAVNPGLPMTISTWVKFKTSAGTQIIAEADGIGVQIYQGSGVVYSGIRGDFPSSISSPVSIDTWYHIVFVVNSTSQRSFSMDGNFIGETSNTVATATGFTKITSRGGGGYFLNGLLDDVRIYDRALSASEVARLYTAGRPGVTGGIYQARTKPKVFAFAGIGGATPWRYIRRQSQIIGSGLGV